MPTFENSTSGREFFISDLAFYTVHIFIITGLNLLNLIVIRHQVELHETMKLLYQLLFVTHTIFGITWSCWSISWCLNDLRVCAVSSMIYPFIFYVSLMLVMVCLCGISLNLYLLITRPLRYNIIVTRKRLGAALSISFIGVVVFNMIYLPIPVTSLISFHTEQCFGAEDQEKSYPILKILFTSTPIFTGFSVAMTINFSLLRIACKQASSIGDSEMGGAQPRQNAMVRQPNGNICHFQQRTFFFRLLNCQKSKGLLTVFLLSLSFLLTLMPHALSYSVAPVKVVHLTDKLALAGTCWLQPMIFQMTNKEARKIFQKIMPCSLSH